MSALRAAAIIGAMALLGGAGAAQAQSGRSAGPPPQSSWGVGSWGQPSPGHRDYGRDGYGYSYGQSAYSYGYSQSYGYQAYSYRPSYGSSADYRPPVRQGYRDEWGYSDDRPPTARGYGRDDGYRRGGSRYRDCDCGGDVYLYDR